MTVELRPPFDRLPLGWFTPYLYAILIDGLDFLGWIPIVGEALDAIQGLLALAIFEDLSISIAGAGADALLVGPLDLIPTFTARVIMVDRGLL